MSRILDNKNVLIVIAHPDDEAMFFGPTLNNLLAEKLFVLCLSNGNYDKLGDIRSKELHDSCFIFGIPQSNIILKDDKLLQDGPDEHWSEEHIASIIIPIIKQYQIEICITFDEYGISYHPNHIATYHGVYYALGILQSSSNNSSIVNNPSVIGYKLQTLTCRKFIHIIDIIVSVVIVYNNGEYIQLPNMHDMVPKYINTYNITWNDLKQLHLYKIYNVYLAMYQHRSQLVWYRYLFMAFSRYSYVNTLELIQLNEQMEVNNGWCKYLMDWLNFLLKFVIHCFYSENGKKS